MSELEDLLVRTLRDPARELPAPADPLPGILARARTQRRNTVLSVAAVVVLAVVAVLTPGALRRSDGLPPADEGREERQIARLRRLAEEAQLDPEFSEKFLRFIIDEVIRHHQRFRG